MVREYYSTLDIVFTVLRDYMVFKICLLDLRNIWCAFILKLPLLNFPNRGAFHDDLEVNSSKGVIPHKICGYQLGIKGNPTKEPKLISL